LARGIYSNLIEGIEFFQNKSDELIASVGPKLTPIFAKKNGILYEQDEYGEEMFFIKQGSVALTLN